MEEVRLFHEAKKGYAEKNKTIAADLTWQKTSNVSLKIITQAK